MTKIERLAYEAGCTAAGRIGDKAPCYDPLLDDLVTNARSEAGHARNAKVLAAWYKGRGWELPKGD